MENERYERQLQLPGFGKAGQEKLGKARVLVVGAGGLGVPVLQYLTAMGVGFLGVVDADVVSLTNLHRQIIYTEEDVGRLKIDCCVPRLRNQNPNIEIKGFPVFLNEENILSVLKGFDVVVDATDNFDARYLINDACVILGIPFVYGALQHFEGHLSVFNYQDGPTYRCLYPSPPSKGQIPDCNTAGVLGIVPGLLGSFQALETIKVITGIGEPLSGTLKIFDFLHNGEYCMKIPTKKENKTIKSIGNFPVSDQERGSISVDQLAGWLDDKHPLALLDVREEHEFDRLHLKNARSIPLSKLPANLPGIPKDRPWILVCEKGGRSLKARQYLQEIEPGIELFNLDGGMSAWIRQVGNLHIEQDDFSTTST